MGDINKTCCYKIFVKRKGISDFVSFHNGKTYGVGITEILIKIFS